MKVTRRTSFHVCSACENQTTDALTYYIGAVAFSLCTFCAKRLAYLTGKQLRIEAEA